MTSLEDFPDVHAAFNAYVAEKGLEPNTATHLVKYCKSKGISGIVYSSTSKYFRIKNGTLHSTIPNTKRTLSLSTSSSSNPIKLRPSSARIPLLNRRVNSYSPASTSNKTTNNRKYGSFSTKNGYKSHTSLPLPLPENGDEIHKYMYDTKADTNSTNTQNTNTQPTTTTNEEIDEFEIWLNDKNLSQYKPTLNEYNIYCINDLLNKSQNEISDISRQIIKELPIRAKFIRAIMLKKNEKREKREEKQIPKENESKNISGSYGNKGMSVDEEQAMKALIGRLSHIFNALKNTKEIMGEIPKMVHQCTNVINQHFDEIIFLLNNQRKLCLREVQLKEDVVNERLERQMSDIKSSAKSLLLAKQSTMRNLINCERSEVREEDILHEIRNSLHVSSFEECESVGMVYAPNMDIMSNLKQLISDDNFGEVLVDINLNELTVKKKDVEED